MNSEKVRIDARYLQLGTRRTAAGIAFFERGFALLRLALAAAVLYNAAELLTYSGGRVLFSAAVVLLPLSGTVAACFKLLKNRWLYFCRAKKRKRFSALFSLFSGSDVLLALRMRSFSFRHKAVRLLLFSLTPTSLAAFSAAMIYKGVEREGLFVLVVGTILAYAVSALFLSVATRSVNAVAALCRTEEDASIMKSSLHRLDESCFELFFFNCSLTSLSSGCREQAKMLYAIEVLNRERSALPAYRRSIRA